MKRLYQGTGLLLTGVLLITGLAGCGQVLGQEEDTAPFYEDRVVTVYLVMDEDDWEYMQQNAIDEEYARADLWYDGELIPDVAVRPKGNSSLNTAVMSGSIRFSFKVDLNFFNSSRNLDGVKKLNFNNGWSDPTLIRETLAYELFEQMGIPTPRTSFVDLWINDTHLGLYTMVEQIDKTFLDNHFDDNSGNLYKPEMVAGRLDWTEDDLGPEPTGQSDDALDVNLGGGKLQEIMEALGEESTEEEAAAPAGDMAPTKWGTYLEMMGLKTNENNPDHSALFRLLDVLNNEPDETFPEEIEKVLDVDQILRFLAVSAAIVHLDNYIGVGHNYYLYEVDGKFTIIPWDMNMAFGTFNSGIDRDGLINFYIDEPTAAAVAKYPLVSRLLSVPSYLETYHGYLEELINGPLSEEAMNSRIDELAELIRPYVEADELKFYSTEVWEVALSADIGLDREGVVGIGMIPLGLKTFVAERVASIRQQLDGELPSSSGDGSGNSGNLMPGVIPGQDRGQGGRMPPAR